MKPITIEDIDSIAEGIKDACCNLTNPKERERFELDAYNYLKEALDPWRDGFPITCLSRGDLVNTLTQKQIDNLSDDDMAYLAGKIGNACLDCCYWEALRVWAEEIIKDKKEDGEE